MNANIRLDVYSDVPRKTATEMVQLAEKRRGFLGASIEETETGNFTVKIKLDADKNPVPRVPASASPKLDEPKMEPATTNTDSGDDTR